MAAKGGFDLASVLASVNVPDSGTDREQIQYIGLSLIDDDPNNFYQLRDIEELAANIASCGLQQPIRVRRHPEQEGRYIIVSGHRRRAALQELVKDDAAKWSEAPCIVDRDDVLPEMRQLSLIFANANTRQLTNAELSEQAVQIETLLRQLEEKGHKFPGRMRDKVADIMQVNKTKLANLKVIREKLSPVWEPMFDANKIGESVALALARMPGAWQKILFASYGKCPSQLTQGGVNNYRDHFRKIENIKCKVMNCACTHTSTMMRVTADSRYSWTTDCDKCCALCSQLRMCKHSCDLCAGDKLTAKEQYKAERAAEKADALAKKEPTLEIIRGVYTRWHEALTANSLLPEAYLRRCGATYFGDDAKRFLKYGKNPDLIKKEEIKLPFAQNLYASDVKALVSAADVLGCSIDWLLVRDVPGPGEADACDNPGWRRDEPEDDLIGAYCIVMTKWSALGQLKPYTMEWTGTCWEYNGCDAVEAGAIISCWIPFPEED